MNYKAELIRLKEYLQTGIQFINDDDALEGRYARQANKSTLEKVDQILKRGEEEKPTSELNTKALPLHGVVQQSELLFAFCTYLEETTNIEPFIHKDRIVANFKGKL